MDRFLWYLSCKSKDRSAMQLNILKWPNEQMPFCSGCLKGTHQFCLLLERGEWSWKESQIAAESVKIGMKSNKTSEVETRVASENLVKSLGLCIQLQKLVVKHIHYITAIRNHGPTVSPQRADTDTFKQQLLSPWWQIAFNKNIR